MASPALKSPSGWAHQKLCDSAQSETLCSESLGGRNPQVPRNLQEWEVSTLFLVRAPDQEVEHSHEEGGWVEWHYRATQ